MVSTDYTWDAVEQFQWCFAEVNAAILCACAPALEPFFVRYLPGLLSSRFRGYDHDEELSKHTGPSTPATPAPQSNSQDRSAKDTHELQWRDDLSQGTSMTKCSANDDETQLWKGNARDNNVATVHESADRARATQ